MKLKAAVVGAGISGLASGQILNKKGIDVTVFEKEISIGGIAKARKHDDVNYHLVGGHCFNTKHKDVERFIMEEITSREEWSYVSRNAKIVFEGNLISYPIEYSIKEISKFNKDLACNAIKDFYKANQEKGEKIENLKEWFEKKFGETLAREYFIPYNNKIWGQNCQEMDYSWVEDKLPQPDVNEFTSALLYNSGNDEMPHRGFYYFKKGINAFIKKLAKNLKIITTNVESIKKKKGGWYINNVGPFDIVINTIPLDRIVEITDTHNDIKDAAKNLRKNGITTMLWECDPLDETWLYFPDPNVLYHRQINITNFYEAKSHMCITEALGNQSYERMYNAGLKLKWLKKPIDMQYSEYAYVVFDKNCESAKSFIHSSYSDPSFINIGRFAEWEYYNMDICIKSAMDKLDSL